MPQCQGRPGTETVTISSVTVGDSVIVQGAAMALPSQPSSVIDQKAPAQTVPTAPPRLQEESRILRLDRTILQPHIRVLESIDLTIKKCVSSDNRRHAFCERRIFDFGLLQIRVLIDHRAYPATTRFKELEEVHDLLA